MYTSLAGVDVEYDSTTGDISINTAIVGNVGWMEDGKCWEAVTLTKSLGIFDTEWRAFLAVCVDVEDTHNAIMARQRDRNLIPVGSIIDRMA